MAGKEINGSNIYSCDKYVDRVPSNLSIFIFRSFQNLKANIDSAL